MEGNLSRARHQFRDFPAKIKRSFSEVESLISYPCQINKMSFYDEIEIEDMTYHEDTTLYTYPCPCGDQFEISRGDLQDGEEVAVCPSCSLQIKVIFDLVGPWDYVLSSSCSDHATGRSTKTGGRRCRHCAGRGHSVIDAERLRALDIFYHMKVISLTWNWSRMKERRRCGLDNCQGRGSLVNDAHPDDIHG